MTYIVIFQTGWQSEDVKIAGYSNRAYVAEAEATKVREEYEMPG
ncbi:unnamed protein product, partial [marine sediment metagenome]